MFFNSHLLETVENDDNDKEIEMLIKKNPIEVLSITYFRSDKGGGLEAAPPNLRNTSFSLFFFSITCRLFS